MKIKYRLISVFYCLILCSVACAQDIHFSQFYNAPLSMNPAMAGAFNGNIRAGLNYRNQWQSISEPYRTCAFSYDMILAKKEKHNGYLGTGLFLYTDKAGKSDLSITQASLFIAYHLKVSENNNLSAGIQSAFSQRSINFSNLAWDNQFNGDFYDPSLPSYETNYTEKKSYFDFAAGFMWNYSKGEMYSTANNQLSFNAGISLSHISRPDISFYSFTDDRLPMKWSGHFNSLVGIKNSRLSLVPALIYEQQGSLKEIVTGISFRYMLVEASKYTGFIKGAYASIGSYYRINDALIPFILIEFSGYSIGISYDINSSGLKTASSGKGGIEISLRFISPNPYASKNLSTKSPRFFD